MRQNINSLCLIVKLIIEIKNMNDMIKKYVLIISALVMIGWGCQKDLDLIPAVILFILIRRPDWIQRIFHLPMWM